MRVAGPSLTELDQLGNDYAALVTNQIGHVLAETARRAHGHWAASSLAVIPTLWADAVDAHLLYPMGRTYWTGVHAVHTALAKHLTASADCGCPDALLAAPLPRLPVPEPEPWDDPFDDADIGAEAGIARVANQSAEQYLAGARNRLVGIGNDVWMRAQQQLLDGMMAGEGIGKLADRITDTTVGIAAPRAEVIARTEVNGAANAGAIDQVRATGMSGTKTWVATVDDRTRPDHIDADGQNVGIDEQFDVGGELLDRPHDPNGSPEQTINCRCTMTYDLDEGSAPAPEEGDEEDMTASGGPAKQITAGLDYVETVYGHFGSSKTVSDKPWNGSPSNFTDEQYQNSAAACDPASKGPPKQRCFLPHHDPGGALNRNGLGGAAGRVSSLAGRNPQAAARAKAHLRGHYSQLGEEPPDSLKAEDDDVTVTDDTVVELAPSKVNCPPGSKPDGMGGCVGKNAAGDVVQFAPVQCPPGQKPDGQGGCVDSGQKAATPPGLKPCQPGTKPDGKGGCAKPGAAAEDGTTYGGKPNKGTKKDRRLHENQPKASALLTDALAEPLADDAAPQWRGPLLVEGVETGDRREFAKGSVSWPDPAEVPLILQWQKETSHGGTNDVTVSVGRIDRVWKDGDLVMGEGRYDTHPDAAEYQRRVESGFAGGISVNADDIADADVEVIYAQPDGAEEDGDLFSMLFAAPEKIIYHAGRLRGATGCDIPAFVEARIAAVDSSDQAALAVSARARRGVAAHETDTSPDEWDAALHTSRLRMVNSRGIAEAAYAWIGWTDDEVPIGSCWGLHHEISEGGIPGPANLTACLHAIMALHESTVPEEDQEAVHRHLAAHLYDAGIRPPVFEREQALLAHAWQDELWHPPAAWFRDPKLSVPTPIIVTDGGQVFGLATEWNTCHIGYGDRCVPPPRETYHDRFLTGTVVCDDGVEMPVGQITAGIGHASTNYGVTAVQAAEHYDNTAAVVADVNVGNCRLGIWVAGAVRPWAETARVAALKASGQVSPDWRRIGGQMRLVGLLTVNVSGFQVPRLRTVMRGGKIEAMIASGFSSVHMGPSPEEQRKIELRRVQQVLRAEMFGERIE